jgi:hypothetical protein
VEVVDGDGMPYAVEQLLLLHLITNDDLDFPK